MSTVFFGLPSSAHAQMAAMRLPAFENTTLDGTKVPFVIEEMKVGNIRHIIDYLLLHGRHSLDNGHHSDATSQLQWAASLMDLNAGLTASPEQEAVRRAATTVETLAQSILSADSIAMTSAPKTLFAAHHALARYHHSRASALLDQTKPNSSENRIRARKNAALHQKAGAALSAALIHFDRATALRAHVHDTPISQDHKTGVKETYAIVERIQLGSGTVGAEAVNASAQTLGEAIQTLRLD
jgi:hypothetical protein